MKLGQVVIELKGRDETSLEIEVPVNHELREILETLGSFSGTSPLIHYSIDPDGITATVVFSDKLRDVTRLMLREGKMPPVPLIKVRLWISSLNGDAESCVIYHNLPSLPPEAETKLIKVLFVIFFASLISVTPSLISLLKAEHTVRAVV